MSNALIAYATSEGQMANLAHEIAGALRARGCDVDTSHDYQYTD